MSFEFAGAYCGKKVLVTGHTGFKGSWLSLWLKKMGGSVVGYSLEPPTTPSLFETAAVQEGVESILGDVRDFQHLNRVITDVEPEIVFHLAAQPLVLESYQNPQETFGVNAIGTVNLLEACRNRPFLKAVVVVTTDKCYENREWGWGYRENDPLGGRDPYSASKAMAEIAAASYRSSFFDGKTAIASARAGNVIGGGDFSLNRLLPDCMRALMRQVPVQVRNPSSVRPWMHVLDPLHGYLLLGKKLMEEGSRFAEAWNFGPLENKGIPAVSLVEKAIDAWGGGDWVDASRSDAAKEAGTLRLNWDKAAEQLSWRPVFGWEEAIDDTVEWYRQYACFCQDPKKGSMQEVCLKHLDRYCTLCAEMEQGRIMAN